MTTGGGGVMEGCGDANIRAFGACPLHSPPGFRIGEQTSA